MIGSDPAPNPSTRRFGNALREVIQLKNLHDVLETARSHQLRALDDEMIERCVEALEYLMSEVWYDGERAALPSDSRFSDAAHCLQEADFLGAAAIYRELLSVPEHQGRSSELLTEISIIESFLEKIDRTVDSLPPRAPSGLPEEVTKVAKVGDLPLNELASTTNSRARARDFICNTVGTTFRWLEQYGLDATVGLSMRPKGVEPSAAPTLGDSSLTELRVADAALSSQEPLDLRVIGRLGAGGMGFVDLAEQTSLTREVAIKRVRRVGDRRAHATLVKEAQLVARLEHPNIPPVHMLVRDAAGEPVLVMQRINGVAWTTLLEDEEHPYWREIKAEPQVFHLKVLLQVAQAIEYAHSRNVLHRDIKTDNVMIGPFGEVYLLDWGVALFLGDDGRGKSQPYGGTPNYSAPEMFEVGVLTARADVFLLGATLHRVLTGHPIHEGDTAAQVLRSAMRSAPRVYDDAVPEQLADVCRKACAFRVEQRYASVREFREALDNYLDHRHLLMQLNAARVLYTRLEGLAIDPNAAPSDVERLGIECRFSFAQVLREDARLEEARVGLYQTLELLANYEIAAENLESAGRLIEELGQYASDLKTLEDLKRRHRSAVEARRQRKSELETQIQYRLMERLQSAQAELSRTADSSISELTETASDD